MGFREKNKAAVGRVRQFLAENDENFGELGRISVRKQGNLRLFDYQAKCQYEGHMTEVERACRGLILNKETGEVVAWPIPKFYNIGEELPAATATLVEVGEKLDGSMGILYRDGGFRVSTRGNFESKQAIWATKRLEKHDLSGLDEQITLIFEIIYPENRIVVDYGNREALVLLAAINRRTGDELSPTDVDRISLQIGVDRPKRLSMTVDDAVRSAKSLINAEGYVLRYSDGSRFKVKSDDYRLKARTVSTFHVKHIIECIAAETYDDLLPILTDEQRQQAEVWRAGIVNEILSIEVQIFTFYEQNKFANRKDYAIAAKAQLGDRTTLAFAALDNRDIRPIILEHFIKNGTISW